MAKKDKNKKSKKAQEKEEARKKKKEEKKNSNQKKSSDPVNEEPVYTVPETIFINPPSYVLAKAGLEICKTDVENFKPYLSPNNSEDNTKTEEEKHADDSGVNAENTGFTLQQGQVTDITHVPHLYVADYEQDYLDMNNNGTVKVASIPQEWAYKGVQVNLKRGWEEQDKQLKWDEMDTVLEGYITEQTYTEEGTELKIDGKNKLLDVTYKFTFKQMSRSNIIREVIKCAGLVPMVDAEGLDDDMIDWTNVSTSGKSSSKGSGDSANVHSSGSATLDEAVEKAIEGQTDELKKAEAIYEAFRGHCYYKYYYNVHHPDLDEAWKTAHLNCADGANVLCAMYRAGGIDAHIEHTPGKTGCGHYIVICKINGKRYASDSSGNEGQHNNKNFGTVWGPSSGSEVGTKIPS